MPKAGGTTRRQLLGVRRLSSTRRHTPHIFPTPQKPPCSNGTPPALAPHAGHAAGGCCIATRKLPAKEHPSTTSSAGGAERPRPLFPCCHFALPANVRGRAYGPPPNLAPKGTPPRPPPFINYCGGSAKKRPRMIVGIFLLSPRRGAPSLVPLLVKGLKRK